jgi:hypothetical protein
MIDSRHYQWLRGPWLGVFSAIAVVLIVLAAVDWQQYALIIASLGIILVMSTGAVWTLLIPVRRKATTQRRF